MHSTTRTAVLIGTVVLLGACGSSLERHLALEIDSDPISEVKKCLDKTRNEPIEKKSVDKFLDCMFDVEVPSDNLEWRLVRGHAVVAMLSKYGAYSLKHDPLNQQEDAQRLLGRIAEAEKQLWAARSSGSSSGTSSAEFKLLTEDAARHDRILDVAQVATAALKPAKRRLVGFFSKIVSLFAAPTPGGIVGALKDVKAAARRAFVIALKGSDYINGTRAWMKNIDAAKNGVPDINDWKAIDDAFLTPACRDISFMAYGNFRTCSPSR